MLDIKPSQSFTTSDNQLHASRTDALRHEAQIAVRSMLQSRALSPSISGGAMTPAQVAEFVISRSDDVFNLLLTLRRKTATPKKKTC